MKKKKSSTNKILVENYYNFFNPGVGYLLAQNEQVEGNVRATVLFIKIKNFFKLQTILGVRLAHSYLSKFQNECHLTITAHGGYLDYAFLDKINCIFGVEKDHHSSSNSYTYDALFCALTLRGVVEYINKKINQDIHNKFNEIKKRYLMFPRDIREKLSLERLGFDIKIGLFTSSPHTGDPMDQLFISTFPHREYINYSIDGPGVFVARQIIRQAAINEIHMDKNTEYQLRDYVKSELLPEISIDFYGSCPVYKFLEIKPLKSTIPDDSFFYKSVVPSLPNCVHSVFNDTIIEISYLEEIKYVFPYLSLNAVEFENKIKLQKCIRSAAVFYFAVLKELGFSIEYCLLAAYFTLWLKLKEVWKKKNIKLSFPNISEQLPVYVNKAKFNKIINGYELNEKNELITGSLCCIRFSEMVIQQGLLDKNYQLDTVEEAFDKLSQDFPQKFLKVLKKIFSSTPEEIPVQKLHFIYGYGLSLGVGFHLIREEKYEKAIKFFHETIKDQPIINDQANFHLAYCYYKINRLKLSERLLNEILIRNEEHYPSILLLLKIWEKQNVSSEIFEKLLKKGVLFKHKSEEIIKAYLDFLKENTNDLEFQKYSHIYETLINCNLENQ